MQTHFLEGKHCETCSLLEAVSFIAFGTTNRQNSRFYTNNEDKIEQAKQDLLLSIKYNNVKAYGTNFKNNIVKLEIVGDVYLNIFNNTWSSEFINSYADEVCRLYTDILINFDDLKQDFQTNNNIETPKHSPSDYTTPYIDIIFSVINKQNITKDNQCKVENLREAIKTEMEERNLPSSDKICSAIATIIRLPESQKGRQKKKI